MSARAPSTLLLAATVLLVAANLRPAITVVGPLVEQIGTGTGLSPTGLGLLGSIPVVAFGAVAPLVHLLAVRWGVERTIFGALMVLVCGTLLRSVPAPDAVPYSLTVYAGTAILAAAIGVGNVLVPAVVKRDFPDRVPMMTGLYTAALVGSAATFSAIAVPLSHAVGWNAALASAALFALLAAACWALRLRGSVVSQQDKPTVPVAREPVSITLWRQPLAWQVTAFFGLQSSLFFLLLTWFPAVQTFHGFSADWAGYWLGMFQAVGVVASLVVGQLIQRLRDQRATAAVIACFMVTALLGMILLPGLMPVWALSAGVSSGASLLLGLTFITLRAGTPLQVGKLSGMAQGVGYLMAASGPLLAGMLFERAGTWTPVLWAALAVAVAQGIFGLLAGRDVRLRS